MPHGTARMSTRPYSETSHRSPFVVSAGLIVSACLVVSVCLGGFPNADAQTQGERSAGSEAAPRQVYPIKRTSSPINVDGVLDERAWREASVIDIAYEWIPADNEPAPVETDVRVTYDERFFYISFDARDPDPSLIRAHLLERDTGFADDHVGFMIDTFNDTRRAFQFRVNPLGVQMDAAWSDMEFFEDFSWDTIWNAECRITDQGYTVEIAVPFSSLRFPRTDDVQTWGFSAFRSWPRNVRHRMRTHPTDRNRNSLLDQTDRITGLQGISPGRNLEFDPTLTAVRTDAVTPGGLSADPRDTDLVVGEAETEIGLTAKWGITPNLIFNGTLNPDFSQVEADIAQLAVNNRFALYFPERRPFFMEGIDFFTTPLNVIYTRTVIDPTAGLKLSGKEGRHALGLFATRDRVMSLIFPTNQGSTSDLVEQDVTTAVLRHRYDVGSSSTLGFLYTGRDGTGYSNRVAGADAFLRLHPTTNLSLQALHSWTDYPDDRATAWGQPADPFDAGAIFANLQHMSNSWAAGFAYQELGSGFRADTGFIPQVDYRLLRGNLFHRLWGGSGHWFTNLNFGLGATHVENRDGRLSLSNTSAVLQYFGPLQSHIFLTAGPAREYYAGRTYDLTQVQLDSEIRPSGDLILAFIGTAGTTVDLANARRADQLILAPAITVSLGRHLMFTFNHTCQRLDVASGRLFTANLSEVRLFYHFSVRTFVRGIVQYNHLDRNPEAYLFEVSPTDRNLFTQFLFSYTVNPQTVLYLGYSDNHLGREFGGGLPQLDLTRTDRTFFFKLGYALVL